MILGASFDTQEENKAFAENEQFPYRLLSDPDQSVGDLYGAKKGPDEQWPMVPRRVSTLIDPQGVVRRTYTVEDVKTHPEEVLNDILSGAAH